jgi:hypothetical protein
MPEKRTGGAGFAIGARNGVGSLPFWVVWLAMVGLVGLVGLFTAYVDFKPPYFKFMPFNFQ